jgi:hypothetical protein
MIEIRKNIAVPWNKETINKLMTFWSTRRFRFESPSETIVSGSRGHLLWNFLSFDSTKLRADLTINPTTDGSVLLAMSVRTTFQQITEWNRAVWELEMTTCESFLLHDDLRETEWQAFYKAYRMAAIIWALTFTLGGKRIPKKK